MTDKRVSKRGGETKLSDKQRKFCEEYVVDYNGTKAAERAGYSPRSAKEQASVLLTKPNIQLYMQELKEKAAERLEVTVDDITEKFKEIAYSSEERTTDRIKALENIAKRLGYYESHNKQKNSGVTEDFSNFTDEELEAYMRLLRKKENKNDE